MAVILLLFLFDIVHDTLPYIGDGFYRYTTGLISLGISIFFRIVFLSSIGISRKNNDQEIKLHE